MKKMILSLFVVMLLLTLPYCVFAADEICNHVIVVDEGVPPSCQEYGITDGAHCSLCGEILKEQELLEPAHTGQYLPAVEATCTKNGHMEGMYCIVCNRVYEGGHTIFSSGHKIVQLPAKAATCNEDGYTYGEQCQICGHIVVAQKVIPAAHQGSVTTKITKATMKCNGKIEKLCISCGETLSKEVIYKIKKISLSPSTYTYDGAAKAPLIKILDSKGNPVPTNYIGIKNLTNRKTVGTHMIKVTFKGRYKGTKMVSFTIKPKGTYFQSGVKRKTSITLNWKKVKKQITGYEIKYSTNKKFTKKTSTTTKIKSYKTTSKRFNGLKSKKNYYFKIRVYKTVNGKNYYSAWSNTIRVKTL